MRHVAASILFALIINTCMASRINAQQASTAPTQKRASDDVNEDLPLWLRFSGEYRVRLEGVDGVGFRSSGSDAFVLGRLRLNTTLAPSSWLKIQLQGQDAQVVARNIKPDAAPFEDTFDLRQAYVEIGNPEARTLGLRVGRQELVFGEQRLVGHVSWANAARSFDAVRATVRSSKVRVDAFASSVVNVREGEFNKRSDANNFHGVYAVVTALGAKATIEPYAFWRVARGQRTEAGITSPLDFKTIGVRWVGKFASGVDYGVETAGQTGSLGSDEIGAWSGHWVLGYVVPGVPYAPRLVTEYNYASGDANPADGRRGTFDQLYPTGHDKYGLADQVGWKNVHHARTGVEFKPSPRMSTAAFYHSWWLADTHDGLYNAAGALVARVASGAAGRHVGQEASFQGVYNLNNLVQFGGGVARVFPGTFLKNATPGRPYNFSYLTVTYQF